MSSQERVDVQARNGRPSSLPNGAAPTGAANGLRTGSDRLPRPPGRRRPGLAVLAVLLIVLGAAVAGLLATRIDQRVPVLVARHEIGVGQLISRDDLAVADVASSGLTYIPANQTAQVIGKYAIELIGPGRLIDGSMLGTSGLLVDGKAAVGIALTQGRYPASGLKTGDVVQVVRTVEGKATLITADAVVGTVQKPGSNVFGASSSTSNTVVTIVVSDQQSPTIAAAAAAQQLSLVLLRRGAVVGGG